MLETWMTRNIFENQYSYFFVAHLDMWGGDVQEKYQYYGSCNNFSNTFESLKKGIGYEESLCATFAGNERTLFQSWLKKCQKTNPSNKNTRHN